jgi:hypothetical protein
MNSDTNPDLYKLEYTEPECVGSVRATFMYEPEDVALVAYVVEGFASGRFAEGSNVEFSSLGSYGAPIRMQMGGMPKRVWRYWLEVLRMRGQAPQPREAL